MRGCHFNDTHLSKAANRPPSKTLCSRLDAFLSLQDIFAATAASSLARLTRCRLDLLIKPFAIFRTFFLSLVASFNCPAQSIQAVFQCTLPRMVTVAQCAWNHTLRFWFLNNHDIRTANVIGGSTGFFEYYLASLPICGRVSAFALTHPCLALHNCRGEHEV